VSRHGDEGELVLRGEGWRGVEGEGGSESLLLLLLLLVRLVE
jgi:hypothetical protein